MVIRMASPARKSSRGGWRSLACASPKKPEARSRMRQAAEGKVVLRAGAGLHFIDISGFLGQTYPKLKPVPAPCKNFHSLVNGTFRSKSMEKAMDRHKDPNKRGGGLDLEEYLNPKSSISSPAT